MRSGVGEMSGSVLRKEEEWWVDNKKRSRKIKKINPKIRDGVQ